MAEAIISRFGLPNLLLVLMGIIPLLAAFPGTARTTWARIVRVVVPALMGMVPGLALSLLLQDMTGGLFVRLLLRGVVILGGVIGVAEGQFVTRPYDPEPHYNYLFRLLARRIVAGLVLGGVLSLIVALASHMSGEDTLLVLSVTLPLSMIIVPTWETTEVIDRYLSLSIQHVVVLGFLVGVVDRGLDVIEVFVIEHRAPDIMMPEAIVASGFIFAAASLFIGACWRGLRALIALVSAWFRHRQFEGVRQVSLGVLLGATIAVALILALPLIGMAMPPQVAIPLVLVLPAAGGVNGWRIADQPGGYFMTPIFAPSAAITTLSFATLTVAGYQAIAGLRDHLFPQTTVTFSIVGVPPAEIVATSALLTAAVTLFVGGFTRYSYFWRHVAGRWQLILASIVFLAASGALLTLPT